MKTKKKGVVPKVAEEEAAEGDMMSLMPRTVPRAVSKGSKRPSPKGPKAKAPRSLRGMLI